MYNPSIYSNSHYFTQNPVDDAWGITITTSGYQEIPSDMEYPTKADHPSGYRFQKQLGTKILNPTTIFLPTLNEKPGTRLPNSGKAMNSFRD